MQPFLKEDIKYIDSPDENVLINSNFNCGFYINRSHLHNILSDNYKIETAFDPCSYPGVKCKFYFNNDEEKANKVSSIIAIIGLINIPIIKYSVDWWNTLHQPASIKLTGESSIHSSMLMPLLLMFFVLILYCALIFLMKYKTEIIKIKKKNLKRL